ncbi:MAG TPA: NAD-dependent epimerase/dehydratase family protein [Pseudomonadales bacterium]
MHVLVIGGTGFIGYHIVKQLQAQGHCVRLLSRHPERARKTFGRDVDYQAGDLNFFRDINFRELFDGIDAIIYAAGSDERQTPSGDPYTFFYQDNVTTCINMLEFAREAGIHRAIVLGSIFTYFARQHPELQLDRHHPYIRSRVEQQKQALALAGPQFTVNVIEIPFVFGHTPGQPTIWKNLVHYIRVAAPMVAPPGGANMISVNTLATAIVNTLQQPQESGPLPVGDVNLTWVELMQRLGTILNKKNVKITHMQSGVLADLTRMGAFFQDLVGFKSGLDHHQISQLITFEAFFDTGEIKQRLHYEGGDLDQALADTVRACPDNPLVSGLQKAVDWLDHYLNTNSKKPG